MYVDNTSMLIGQPSTFIDEDNNRLINKSFINKNDSIFKYPQDMSKTIDERALIMFEPIIGHDKIKKLLYRALLRKNKNLNNLLIGASGTAKTLFMYIIEKMCNGVLFYDAASGSTSAGLIELLERNRNVKILIIDEIAELKRNSLETFRGLLNDGRINKTLKRQIINLKLHNLKIFATTNNPTVFSDPFKSRFNIYEIKPYNDDEFIKVMQFCLLDQEIVKDAQLAKELSYAMLEYGITNVRKAISFCALVQEGDTIPVIQEMIEDYISVNGENCNINYNEKQHE